MADFLPRRDADLLSWSSAFKKNIAADPTKYGLTEAQALAYAAKHDAFAAAYQTAIAPATRSPVNVSLKDAVRAALKAEARMLVRFVRATPSVTDAQLRELGLTPRSEPAMRGIGKPTESPEISVMTTLGNTVRVRLWQPGSSRRGKPDGVAGAAIYSCISEEPPSSLSDWKLATNTTRTVCDVPFDDTLAPGTQVWLCACWFNPKHENGPMSHPVSIRLAGGAVLRLQSLAA